MKNGSATHARRQRGVSLIEFAAALLIGLPLLITIMYVAVEASILFAIRTNIDIAARQASRNMAIQFGQNANTRTDRDLQQAVYTRVRIPGFVVANSQFSDPTFAMASPATVTVTCTYPANGGGLGIPPFPNPDPLNLGGRFDLRSTATFPLE